MCASWTSGLSGYLSIKAAAPLAVLALVAAGCSTSEPTSTPTITTTGGTEAATVSRVSDGDTLRTTSGRKIRLVQIDAPELHGDCFGKGALAALRKLTPPGTRITLERDPTLDSTDRYGRQLRYVFVDGTNINVALVRQGAASPYFFAVTAAAYATDLLDAVDEARASNRGYWSACPDAPARSGARLDHRAD